MQAFLDQVNATSKCITLDCTGFLKPISVNLTRFGDAVDIDYDCTGCLERWLIFSSSALHEKKDKDTDARMEMNKFYRCKERATY